MDLSLLIGTIYICECHIHYNVYLLLEIQINGLL